MIKMLQPAPRATKQEAFTHRSERQTNKVSPWHRAQQVETAMSICKVDFLSPVRNWHRLSANNTPPRNSAKMENVLAATMNESIDAESVAEYEVHLLYLSIYRNKPKSALRSLWSLVTNEHEPIEAMEQKKITMAGIVNQATSLFSRLRETRRSNKG